MRRIWAPLLQLVIILMVSRVGFLHAQVERDKKFVISEALSSQCTKPKAVKRGDEEDADKGRLLKSKSVCFRTDPQSATFPTHRGKGKLSVR